MADILAVAEAGMLNDVQRLNALGHNLANANTVGFKKEIVIAHSFAERLTAMQNSARATTAVQVDHSAGALKHTGNPLDIALEGPGFLVVATPNGEAYTRQGNLQIDASGRLVTANGYVVQGVAGDIQLTTPEPRIDAQGYVWEDKNQIGQLKLVSVQDPAALASMGQGLYAAGPATDIGDDVPRVRQGFVEAANVVTMNEMIKMIETVRHFEASQRLVHGYDDMLDRAINVAGEIQ